MSSVRERSVLYNYEMAHMVRPITWQNDPRSQPLAHQPIDVACLIASRGIVARVRHAMRYGKMYLANKWIVSN
jgi:hypothetical protein